jgi:hypothetical protein
MLLGQQQQEAHMAFVPYVRLVMGGTLRTTQTWSMGMSFLVTVPHTQSELLAWLGVMDPLVKAFFNTAVINANAWDTTTTYNSLRAYEYTAVGGASSQAQIFSSGSTGIGAQSGPAQCAIVLSVRSGIGGRNKRGRLYLPATAKAVYSTVGQMSSGDCTSLANAFKTLVDAANASHIGTDAVIFGIASRGSGFTVAGQDVKVDGKIDTQRRRTDKILAANSAIAVF